MMYRLCVLILALIWTSILFGQSGPDWTRKVSRSLMDDSRSGDDVPFVILLHEQADIRDASYLSTKDAKASFVYQSLFTKAQESQRHLVDYLQQHNISFQSLFIVNAIRAAGDMELIKAMAQRKDVARIVADPAIHYAAPVEWTPDMQSSRTAVEWGIDMINADEVWALGYRGQGILVGGADTGYEWGHPALKQQYAGYDPVLDTADHNYAWHDAIHMISPLAADSINPCGLDVREPCDDGGHGTHTMGTMIGLDGENQIGVAPEAKWCACRNMERGWGAPSTYLECFQWFLAPTDLNGENPDPSKAPHVINNSWYCSEEEGCDSSNWVILEIAVNNLKAAGTVVIVSAGNSGSGCSSIAHPAAMFENSFSVGATAFNDTIAGFSSRGPVIVDGSGRLKPNVAAPGVGVRSARPGGVYGGASGTSMAGPHVAGLVALILSANPELAGHVDVIEGIIEQTAVSKTTEQACGEVPGTNVPNHTYGYGRVDALAAVEAALELLETGTEESQVTLFIRAYPNPVKDVWMIDAREWSGIIQVDIFDVHGRLVRTVIQPAQSVIRFDFSTLHKGIYSYAVRHDGGTINGSLIKA